MYNGPNSAPPADTPVKLLAGDPYLTESLLGFEFRVSPLSFFQVNTFAAEKLYAKVRRHARRMAAASCGGAAARAHH